MFEGGGGVERLRAVLRRQGSLLERLASLSQRQGEALRGRDLSSVLAIVEERQPLVDELEALQREVVSLRRELARSGGATAERDDAELGELLDAVVRQAAELEARDAADRRELESQRELVAKELSGLTRGERANSAYGPGGQDRADPMYQDRIA